MYISKTAVVVVVTSLLTVLSAGARAANPIEFEFGGVLTQTTGSVLPAGPFTTTVRFDPGAADADPSPSDGRYPYISWSVPGATASPVVFDNPPISIGDIRIDAEIGGDHQWRLEYRGAFNFSW